MKLAGFRLLIATATTVTLACGSGQDSWVARVGDAAISLEELEQAVAPRTEDEPESLREDLVHEELERLVVQLIALNRAQQLGVEVSDAEVELRIQQMVGNDPVALDEVASPEFREELRREMTIDRAAAMELADRIQISESALVHYYEEHRERYDQPERVQIRQIVVPEEEKAVKLLAELRKGADFAELATQHSIAPESREGGLLPPFAAGEMPEEFDRAFKLRPGQLSEVIASPFGFHIFLLEARLDAIEPTLDDVRGSVRAELERERLAELRRDWLRELRVAADIRVNEPVLEALR